jgi:putative nucleotidyltransferase with HDIG domain
MVDPIAFGEKLRDIILHKIQDNALELPTYPKVASFAHRQLQNPEVKLQEVAQTLERDPLLAAQILKQANSPLYGGSQEITSLNQALSRMGIRAVVNVLRTSVARTIFMSRRPEVQKVFQVLWNHSLAVAHMARDVLGIAGARDADPAYLAGLLHDVGKPTAAAFLLDFENSLPRHEAVNWVDENEWLAIIQDIHHPISLAIAEKWKLPQAVLSVLRSANEYDVSDRVSPANAVRFANALSKQLGIYAGYFDSGEIATQLMVGRSLLGLEEETVDKLGKKAQNTTWD